MALGDVISRLSVHLGLETAAFDRNVGKAKNQVTGMERHMSKAGKAVAGAFTAMFGAFAVGQLASMAKESLAYASSLGEVATQLGTTTASLQQYRFAATQTGIEQDEMDKGLAKLSRTIGEAAGGNEKAAKMFDRLGISIRDSNGNVRDAGDILPEIANAYTKLGSAAEQSALSAEVFGSKLGQKLNPLLAEGAKGIQKFRDEAERMGLVLSDDVIKNADNAADQLSTLEQFIKMKFNVTIAEQSKEIGDLATSLLGLISSIGSVRNEWRKLQLTMEQFDIWTEGLGTSSFSSRMERTSALQREKDLLNGVPYQRGLAAAQKSAEAQRIAPAYSGVGLSRKTPFSIAPKVGWPTTKAMGANAFGGMDMARFTPGQGEGFIRMAAAVKEMAPSVTGIAASFASMSGTDAPRLLATIRQMKPELEALRNSTQGILDRLFPDEAEARRYAEELAILNAALAKGQISLNTHASAVMALRREYSGFTAAIEEAALVLSTEVGPSLDEISDAISDRLPRQLAVMGDDAEAATVRVASSFADMAESITASLGSIVGGKTGKLFSSLLNIGLQLGKAGAFGSDASSFLNRVPAYANGTNFARGGLSLVGERGPELVNLPRGASVTPNNKLGGATLVEIVDTTGLFVTRVNGIVQPAAIAAAQAGTMGGVALMQRRASRRFA